MVVLEALSGGDDGVYTWYSVHRSYSDLFPKTVVIWMLSSLWTLEMIFSLSTTAVLNEIIREILQFNIINTLYWIFKTLKKISLTFE